MLPEGGVNLTLSWYNGAMSKAKNMKLMGPNDIYEYVLENSEAWLDDDGEFDSSACAQHLIEVLADGGRLDLEAIAEDDVFCEPGEVDPYDFDSLCEYLEGLAGHVEGSYY